ncbi:hypothetical protein HYPSUDRAFT_57445 [Hypholoma sublateritium FD-334 SS-4]|uniref:F-box domain-containing protein n=1 Tax=Hypholoma sublateritium (strain FD-334 SS-4) TaxID=945553 RepID=A0A0D2NMK0_HYPSF|nr:hypothetical protein HYPSUDRAFT_57445 [Hypholoma sublateritium FD-334 SS-4]
MTSVQLPQEIYDEIIYHLHRDPTTLRATALAHRALLSTAQKCLFAHIVLFPPAIPGHLTTASRLHRHLINAPHLGRYVDRLDLHICAGRAQWKGWAALADVLPALPFLSALGVHVDQSLGWESSFLRLPPTSGADTSRIVSALAGALVRRTLVHLDTHCVDTALLLPHAHYIRELTLSAPITPAAGAAQGRAEGLPGEVVLLEGLRIENTFDLLEYYPYMLREALRAQGIAVGGLRRLSMMYHGYHAARCLEEMLGILEECNGVLEELEIDVRVTANGEGATDAPVYVLMNAIDLNTLVQYKASALLPSLRVLHIHLHPHDAANAPDDPRALITALGSFLRALNTPSSGSLVRLALTDHGALGDGAGADVWLPLFRDVLGDARHFPSLRVVSLQGEGAGMDALYAAAVALPYELRAGPGWCPQRRSGGVRDDSGGRALMLDYRVP